MRFLPGRDMCARFCIYLATIIWVACVGPKTFAAAQDSGVNGVVSIVYSKEYLIDLGGYERMHPFDIRKYDRIHRALLADNLLTDAQTHRPAPITEDQIKLIHNEEFLTGLRDKETVAVWLEAQVLARLPVDLDKGILEKFRRSSGGTLLAGRLALKHGVGINIGGGYHHAKPNKGEGFCIYADIPIAIRQLQNDGLIQRAVIIDVDAHQGNGTAVCLADDEKTFTFSMHQGDIYPNPRETSDLDVELVAGTNDEAFLKTLDQHLEAVLEKADADICFIVGGCDTLREDPLAALEMTQSGIVTRDERIVRACRDRNLPVVLTLAGGYSDNAWRAQYLSIKNLIEKFVLAENKDE